MDLKGIGFVDGIDYELYSGFYLKIRFSVGINVSSKVMKVIIMMNGKVLMKMLLRVVFWFDMVVLIM